MRRANCVHEDAVAKAVRTDTWPAALAAHAAECGICREIAQAARWMQALSTGGDANSLSACVPSDPLPDPGAVWRRAHVAEEPFDAKKIRSALEWVQIALNAAIPVALAGWVAWNWYPIEMAAAQFLANIFPTNALPQFVGVMYPLASLAPAALTLGVLSLAYPVLAGD